MDWNGVEERYELERRKDKLVSQLEEAASLWKSINKRTGLIAGYIQQNLFYQVGTTSHCVFFLEITNGCHRVRMLLIFTTVSYRGSIRS